MRTTLKKIIKNNKGYTGIDLSVSIIAILISVSVIASLFYNLYFTGTGMKRNVIATNYAINILEIIQATEYSKVTFNSEEDNSLLLKNALDNLPEFAGKSVGTIVQNANNYEYINSIENYTINVQIEKYSDRFNEENAKEDYIKIITVHVKYNLGKKVDQNNNEEELTISTLKTIN